MKTIAFLLAVATAGAAQAATTYYVSPAGNDSAAGTIAAPWKSIARAQAQVQAGDLVLLRGGRYAYSVATSTCASRTAVVDAISLNKSGKEGAPIRYWAFPGETPVFDFTAMKDDCRVKGINLSADWLHLKGLEITGAPQQPENRLNHESWGLWIKGSHNIVERIDAHHNMGPGVFINDGAHNLVLNSDSHHNHDPYTSNGAGQSADGFGAHIKAGKPGNVFRGCRAWANTDDGFDLINAHSPVVIEHSWAWSHGYLPGTTTSLPAGNGNGIKAGGFGGKYLATTVKHIVRYSVAFNNKVSGFYANHHPLALEFHHNTAFGNKSDFNMRGITPDGQPASFGELRDNVGYTFAFMDGVQQSGNSWQGAATPAPDLAALAAQGWDAPRKPDGSLPDLRDYQLRALDDAGQGALARSKPLTARK